MEGKGRLGWGWLGAHHVDVCFRAKPPGEPSLPDPVAGRGLWGPGYTLELVLAGDLSVTGQGLAPSRLSPGPLRALQT